MVLIRKHTIIRRVKDITIGSTLTLALLGGTGLIQSCDNRDRYEGGEYETVETKGVQTHLQEIEKGEFKITDERTVDPSDSKVFITYLDGHTDTLNVEQARRIVERDAIHSNDHYYHGSGLSNALFYGGLGYMIGQSMNNRYYHPYDGGGNYGGSASRYYASPEVYERSRRTGEELSRSRAVKPSNSKRGFFSKSRTSGSRGFRGFGG